MRAEIRFVSMFNGKHYLVINDTHYVELTEASRDDLLAGLTEMRGFTIIDVNTGVVANTERIVAEEEWAKSLSGSMQWFAITQNGLLILLDECGNYARCPFNRFVMEEYL